MTLILIPLVVPYIVLAVGMVVLLHELGIATSLVAVLRATSSSRCPTACS